MKLYPDILTDEDLRQSPTSVSRPQQLYPSFSRHHRLNRSVNLPPSSPSSPSSSSSSSFSSSSSASPIPSITTSDSRSTFSSVDTALTSASGGGLTEEQQQDQQPRYDKNHNPIGGSRAGSLPTIIYHEIYSKESSRNGGNNNSNSHSSRFFTLDRSFGERHQFQQSFEKKAPLPVESISEDDGQSSGQLTLRVAIAALAAFLTSSLPSGFNMGVVNTPEATFKDFFNYTLSLSRRSVVVVDRSQIELLWSVAVSLLLVGAFIGCTFTGYLADRIGRRGLLILNALLGLLGAALCWMAKFLGPSFSLPVFITGRFISGLHTGVGSSLVPMYLIEIAPKNGGGGGGGGGLATALGVLHVIGLNGGQMVAMTLGLQSVLGSSTRWQLLFAVNGAFIVAGLALLLLLSPESPTYLYVLRRNEPKAISALLALRGKGSVLELLDEVAAMRLEAKSRQSGNAHQLSIFTILKNSRRFRTALAVVCALHAGQQLAGINAVFYYSTKTFRSVGLADLTAQYSSIGCTALNTAMALVAVALIRRLSSRTLLLTSGLATSVCLLLLTLSMSFQAEAWLNFATIAIILAYVLFFAIGQGPIPFMIGGELFDQSTMAIGMSIGCFVNWFCNFLIAITFPMIAMLINQYVFLLFLAFNLLLLVFVYLKVSPRKSVEAGNGDLEDGGAQVVVTEKRCSSAKERTLGGVV